MTEERIIIEIDDSQLQNFRLQLGLIEQQAVKTIGGRGKTFESVLPSITREMRIIATQLPGLNKANRLLFDVKRLERGMFLGGTDKWLSIIATMVLFLSTVLRYQQDLQREEKRYERLIRSYKDLSHAEFQILRKQEKAAHRGWPW